MTKKITLLISDLDCGGAQRVMLTLAEEFTARGYRIDLVQARAGGILNCEVPSNINTISLCNENTWNITLPLKTFIKLSRYLIRERPDAILSSVTGANLIAVLARKFVHPNTVLVLRHENTGQNVNNRMREWIMKKLYYLADNVITISSGAATDLVSSLNLPNAMIHVIENPINPIRIREKAQERAPHNWFNDHSCPVFLAAGRLVPQKDFETLIRAFHKLSLKRPAHLMILGEGPERNRLEDLVGQLDLDEIVLIPGTIHNPYPWMNAAKVFVLSSRWEGLPIVLMEAMALGCRIVATDCHSGPRELLGGGLYGKLVPVANEKQLMDAMLDALESSHEPEEIMAQADLYASGSIAERHLEILELQRT